MINPFVFSEMTETDTVLSKLSESYDVLSEKELNSSLCGINSTEGELLQSTEFCENYDDKIPALDEIKDLIESGRELSYDELKDMRPDLADYIDKMRDRLGHNEYADSVKVYLSDDGDIILAGKDDRSYQESNYAVVRGKDIFCHAGNARGDGHLNEFANNTDGYVPNAKYHFENATYVTNDLGQVTTVYEYHITERHTDRNEGRGELKSVSDAKGGLLNDVGGHLVAHNIDGPTESINILPMNEDFNNGGEWKSMEGEFLNEYQNGRSFTVKKEIVYDPETGRPSHIDVTAEMGNGVKHWSYDLP